MTGFTLALDVALTIPDNEALTALGTLRRHGLNVAALERSDVWCFDVAEARRNALIDAVRGIETIFNPNKHRLRVREHPRPRAGEVWVDEPSAPARLSGPPFHVGGRELPGATRAERFTAWRLLDERGSAAPSDLVDRALETLLWNPAFQRAIR